MPSCTYFFIIKNDKVVIMVPPVENKTTTMIKKPFFMIIYKPTRLYFALSDVFIIKGHINPKQFNND